MIVKSLFAKITGSAGGITVSNWKGKSVAKERIITNKSSSLPQQFQRARFAYITNFAFLFGYAFLKEVWARYERQTTYINEFTGHNVPLQPVFVDNLTPFVGIPTDVLFTKGILEPLATPIGIDYSPGTGQVGGSYVSTIVGNGQATDLVYMIIIDLINNFTYVAPTATRADGIITTTIPAGLDESGLLGILTCSQELLDGSTIYGNSRSQIAAI